MLAAASMLIASKLKSPDLPTITEWIRKVKFVGLMAKFPAICRFRAGNKTALTTFAQQWGPLMYFQYPGFSQLNIWAEVLALL